MRIFDVFARAWRLTWSYRATWVLGALLALTAGNGLFLGWAWRQRGLESHNTLRLTPSLTVNFPGHGLSIDLTDPQSITIQALNDGLTGLEAMVGGAVPEVVRTVLAGGLILSGLVLAALIAVRYVSEAGLIRMVAEVDRGGGRASVGQGWRWGWSRTAWRLLLIDILVTLGVTLAIIIMLALALAPLLLWLTRNTAAGVVGTVLTSGLLVAAGVTVVSCLILASVVIQAARRQSAIDGLGVLASIRTGGQLVWEQPAPSFLTWLLWMAVRFVWTLATVPLAVLLAPLALLMLPFAAMAGGFSALVVGGFSAMFLKGVTPWLIAAVAGVPLFALILASPILAASAPIETLKSSLWTLAVPELRRLPARAKKATSVAAPPIAPGPSSSEPLPVLALVAPRRRSVPAKTKRTSPARKPTAKSTGRPARKSEKAKRPTPKAAGGKVRGGGKRASSNRRISRRRT